MPAELFPFLLTVHVALAVGLLLPSILLPFALRARRSVEDSRSPVVRALVRLQAKASVVLGAGLALTGLGMLSIVGDQLVEQPWLLAALGIYALNLVLAFFVQRPNLRRLLGIRASADDETWRAWARRQRYVSYAMAGLVGTIGFLMSAKPRLW